MEITTIPRGPVTGRRSSPPPQAARKRPESRRTARPAAGFSQTERLRRIGERRMGERHLPREDVGFIALRGLAISPAPGTTGREKIVAGQKEEGHRRVSPVASVIQCYVYCASPLVVLPAAATARLDVHGLHDHELTVGSKGRLLPIIPARGNHDSIQHVQCRGFPRASRAEQTQDLAL